MNPFAEAGLAGGLGGAIGQILSAPRRAVWGMLGGPETGAELVANLTGADPSSSLASYLGAAAEMALDPLALGMAAAPAAFRLARAPWREEAQLLSRAGAMTDAETAGLNALRGGQEASAFERTLIPAREADLGRVDLSGIGQGATKTFRYGAPDVVQEAQNLGIGYASTPDEMRQLDSVKKLFRSKGLGPIPADDEAFQAMLAGNTTPGMPPEGITFYGRSLPEGYRMGVPRLPSAPPPEGVPPEAWRANLLPGARGSMPLPTLDGSTPTRLSPWELNRLWMGQADVGLASNLDRSLAADLAIERAARNVQAAAPPGATLADVIRPTVPPEVLGQIPAEATGLPVRQGLNAMQLQSAIDSARLGRLSITSRDLAAIAGAGGLAAYLGGQAFGLGR